MMRIAVAVPAVMIIGALNTLMALQTVVGAAPDTNFMTQAERLTLQGALILAVWVLWRALTAERQQSTDRSGKKDELIVEMTKTVTAALNQSTASSTELRESNKELRTLVEGFLQSVGHLQSVAKP